jgi:hypothetical protein
MHKIGACVSRCVQELCRVEITARRRRSAKRNRLVGFTDVKRVLISFGIDRNGANAKGSRGAKNSARNNAAIGDEKLSMHGTERADE